MSDHEPSIPAAVRSALGQGLADHPEDGLVVLSAVRDEHGAVVDFHHDWVNQAGLTSAGRPLVGTRLLAVYGPDATLFETMRDLVEQGGTRLASVAFDGSSQDASLHERHFAVYLAVVDGDRIVCQYRDVTDLHRARLALEHEARHDELTGIPNRRQLRDHLARVLAGVEAGAATAVLVLLTDLDRFKQVNDEHGHAVGDELLRLVAGRMRAATRSGDLVARYGGDEFVVVASIADEAEADAVIERLREAVTGPYRIDGATTVEVGLSIGRALVTAPAAPEDVLTRADRALYRAKEARGR